MDKKEFQKVIKQKFKDEGFKSKGNHCYKIIDNKMFFSYSIWIVCCKYKKNVPIFTNRDTKS